MSTATHRPVPLTDDRGTVLLGKRMFNPNAEPNPGSVVLSEGEFGTAWQRFFSDGRWHPTRGGGSRSWDQMLTKRNLVLVYDAPVRGDQR
jgi:hypothetical protein